MGLRRSSGSWRQFSYQVPSAAEPSCRPRSLSVPSGVGRKSLIRWSSPAVEKCCSSSPVSVSRMKCGLSCLTAATVTAYGRYAGRSSCGCSAAARADSARVADAGVVTSMSTLNQGEARFVTVALHNPGMWRRGVSSVPERLGLCLGCARAPLRARPAATRPLSPHCCTAIRPLSPHCCTAIRPFSPAGGTPAAADGHRLLGMATLDQDLTPLPADQVAHSARVERLFRWLNDPADPSWERPAPTPAQRRHDVLGMLGGLLAGLLMMMLAKSIGRVIEGETAWHAYVAVAAMVVPLAVRRARPLLTLVVSSVLFLALSYFSPEASVSLTFQVAYFTAIYTAVAWARNRRALWLLAVLVLGEMTLWLVIAFTMTNAMRGASHFEHASGPMDPQ